MSFNLTITLVAVGIGVASAAGASWRHRGLAPIQLAIALGIGAVCSGLALLVTDLVKDDIFAVAHMAYLIFCISIPVAALLMMLRAAEAPIGGRLLLGVGLVPAAIGVYATHVVPFQLQTEQVSVAGPGSAEGLRIGVLSDLQTDVVGSYENEAIDTLLAQSPDVVLIPGDFWQMPWDELVERSDQFAEVVARLDRNVEHVVAVHGNTDSLDGWRLIAEGTDVVVLDNSFVDLTVRGIDLRVGGMSLGGPREQRTGVIDALAAASPSTATILLAHKPDVVYGVPAAVRVDVVVAGHTHGGQIQLPGIGPLTVLSTVPRSVGAGGLSAIDGQPIYVSTGVGREKGYAPQVRFGAQPSIGVLTFFDGGFG